MSTFTPAASAQAGDGTASTSSATGRDRARRRALRVVAGITVVSLVLLADLLLVRHTTGEEIWGPITAAMAALAGVSSLVVLAKGGRSRLARYGLIALWLTVAFFGFGGYQSHRLGPSEGAVDPRPRPPLAPLVFTGMGIAGAVVLRYGTKGN